MYKSTELPTYFERNVWGFFYVEKKIGMYVCNTGLLRGFALR